MFWTAEALVNWSEYTNTNRMLWVIGFLWATDSWLYWRVEIVANVIVKKYYEITELLSWWLGAKIYDRIASHSLSPLVDKFSVFRGEEIIDN